MGEVRKVRLVSHLRWCGEAEYVSRRGLENYAGYVPHKFLKSPLMQLGCDRGVISPVRTFLSFPQCDSQGLVWLPSLGLGVLFPFMVVVVCLWGR